jgi:hypothetical protein
MARIQVIPPERSEGELRKVYALVRPTMPRVGKLVQICSLRPDWVRLMVENMLFTLEAGSLSRQTKEFLAVATSRAGNCLY